MHNTKNIIIVFIILLSFISLFYFIKYNVNNNTQLFYKYKNKIPLKVKYKIRKYLTKSIICTFIKNVFKFEKRKDKITLNKDLPADELILLTILT